MVLCGRLKYASEQFPLFMHDQAFLSAAAAQIGQRYADRGRLRHVAYAAHNEASLCQVVPDLFLQARELCLFGCASDAHPNSSIRPGTRAVIWLTCHVVSVPAITGVHGTIATVAWIFMQAIVSRERTHMPQTG
jgi:hypothetical protein